MNPWQRMRAESQPAHVINELIREFLDIQTNTDVPPTIAGYTDLTKHGRGAFGVVYKARRTSDGATVALKTMLQTHKPTAVRLPYLSVKKKL